ncbi:hypothetical protein CEXT_814941 [Caerostris extrusa]|uniref:Uncharacterized protein n=1 Tax=Caerostris extrusa TaxID=172846 RepID=A0AAV4VR83_CAEEX|nr:hypothetical protein CEXT_814941 [Caerostris extrusa]
MPQTLFKTPRKPSTSAMHSIIRGWINRRGGTKLPTAPPLHALSKKIKRKWRSGKLVGQENIEWPSEQEASKIDFTFKEDDSILKLDWELQRFH